MPKRLKNARRDVNQLAHDLVSRLDDDASPEKPVEKPTNLSEYMASIGRRGGQIGGKRRLQTLTREKREEIALKAARARWGKPKKVKARRRKTS